SLGFSFVVVSFSFCFLSFLFRFCLLSGRKLPAFAMMTFGTHLFRHFPKNFHDTANRNAREPMASERYVPGHGRCEYQRARVTIAMAPVKNRTRPTAAATPIKGTP